MIHLDANVLIRQWLLAGQPLAASAPAWFEYISGPVTAQEISRAEAILRGGVEDFEKLDSQRSADLFNATGRKRAMKLDCMIAASATLHSARLATTNVGDFQAFVTQGLAIEPVPA